MDLSFPLLVAQMIISLAIVVGLMVLIARYVNKRTGGVLTSNGRRARVSVVGRTNVGQRASVQVVQVAERMLVVGVTDSTVRLLTELHDDDVAVLDAQLAAEAQAQRAAIETSPVHQWVAKFTTRPSHPDTTQGSDQVAQAASDQRRHVFESVLALRKKRGR